MKPHEREKRIYEYENFDFDKDLAQLSNTRHLISPSNPNLLIFNLLLVTMKHFSKVWQEVKRKRQK
jgi:hypothetical protein